MEQTAFSVKGQIIHILGFVDHTVCCNYLIQLCLCTGEAAMMIMVWSLSHVQLFVTLWTVVCQAPLSMGFPRQEYWIGLPFPSPGNIPDPGIEPVSPAWQASQVAQW